MSTITRATQSKIHIARHQLGMDEDVYRGLLKRTTGSESSKDLTERQGQAALAELTRLGFSPKPPSKDKAKGKPHNFNRLPNLIVKIEAQLADMGLPWSYADAIANQMWKRQRIAWTREEKKLKAILAALHVEQNKRGLLALVESHMAILGPTDPKWQALLDRLPKGWRRNVTTLQQLAETLGLAVEALEADHVDGR